MDEEFRLKVGRFQKDRLAEDAGRVPSKEPNGFRGDYQ